MYKKLILMLTIGALMILSAGCGKRNQESAEGNEGSAVDISAADSANASVDSADLPELSTEEEDDDYEPAELACSLPKGFRPDSQEDGLYVHKSYPTDLSTISYDISDNNGDFSDMTLDEYKSLVEEDFLDNFGDEVILDISSYEEVVVDRRKGFRIEMSYTFKGVDYEQLTYILFNGNELHNLTFTQEKDGGWMDKFKESAESMHFVKTGN